jgi:hypothetical protein
MQQTEEEVLHHAYANGRAGNNDGAVLLGSSPVCSIDVPQEHGRTWLLTLLSARLFSNPPLGLVAGIPPDNQVFTRYQVPGSQGPCPVRIEYGTGQAQESVIIDYPWGGGSFAITAAHVRVYVVAPAAVITNGVVGQARLGGFLTGRVTQRSQPLTVPTFTIVPVSLAAAGGSQIFWAPNRAIGFRLFTSDQLSSWTSGAAAGIVATQVISPAASIQSDGIDGKNGASNGVLLPDDYGGQGGSGSQWFKLNPMATGVSVQNTDSLFAHAVGVQWIIDLA